MSKRNIAIFLGIIMMLSGCSKNVETPVDNSAETNAMDKKIQITDREETVLPDGISLVWRNTSEYSNEEVPFIATNYTPKVPKYNVDKNLGNIVNISRFEGLSKEQVGKLANNGFVVLNPNPDNAYHYMKMYDIYEENEYKYIPSFISVDVALHMYHKFFDETLKSVEKEHLNEALKELTKSMLDKTKALYLQAPNEEIKKDLGDIMIYFSVANNLINSTYGDIPKELIPIAEREINEIKNTSGYIKSPLFGFDINYEQFIARGHYTEDEDLESYFKTMMWYGLIGYPFEDESGEF